MPLSADRSAYFWILRKLKERGGQQQGLKEQRRVGGVRSLNSRCSSSLYLTPNETRSRNAPEDRGQVYVGGGEGERESESVRESAQIEEPKDRLPGFMRTKFPQKQNISGGSWCEKTRVNVVLGAALLICQCVLLLLQPGSLAAPHQPLKKKRWTQI